MKRHGGNMYYPHSAHPPSKREYYSPPSVTGLPGMLAVLIGYEAGTLRGRGKECSEEAVMKAARTAAEAVVSLWRREDAELVQRCAEMAAVVAEDAAKAILRLPEAQRPL